MKRMLKNLALAALVVLAGCSNIFAPAIKPRDPPAGANQGGTVRINIEGERSSARTLLPAASGGFTKYDLLFEDQAGLLPNVNEYNYTPNAEVTIPKGTWTVTVSAYLSDGAGGDRLAATGEAEVAAVYGETGEPVPVILRPVDTANDYTGNGTFAWNISFPVSTSAATLTITQLDGTPVQTLSLKGPADHGILSEGEDRSEGSIALSAGSYYIRTVLTRGSMEANPPKATRRDALFILEGMATIADAAAGYAFTDDSFSKTIYVTNAADSGQGSLRQAISEAKADDTIQVTLPPKSVIALDSSLSITQSLTIEGNGATLIRGSGSTALIHINSASAQVAIRRLRFEGGQVPVAASALYLQAGGLVLESCVFSGNQRSDSGGPAIHALGTSAHPTARTTLTALGCTFYGNKATSATAAYAYGGAIYVRYGDVKLAGNLFHGNSGQGYHAVYPYSASSATVVSLGYNVSSLPGGVMTTDSGFDFTTGDTQAESSVSLLTFKSALGSGSLGAVNVAAFNAAGSNPAYPERDFYGDPIPETGAAAGAVQGGGTGYSVNIVKRGSGEVTGLSPVINADGLVAPGASFTLTASPATANDFFVSLTVNGATQDGNTFAVANIDKHLEVLAVFGKIVADRAEFIQALENPNCDVVSLPPNGVITLSSRATITRNLIIEGNGAVITQSGFTASSSSQLLFVNGAVNVVIRRVHFKDGLATNNGSAIGNTNGTLTLESCVFSGNKTVSNGGAVYTTGAGASLTILGCTFCNNGAEYGGAVYVNSGTVNLAGNLFYGNTATNGPVVYRYGGTVMSLGYNVSDLSGGTGAAESGFSFVTGDTIAPALSFSPANFKPGLESSALNKVDVAAFNSANAATPYPTQDFYGDPIVASGTAAAGAVQSAGTGYGLGIVTAGLGTVDPSINATDSFYVPDTTITLTAGMSDGGVLDHVNWTVNGVPRAETGAAIQVIMTGNTLVRAEIWRRVTVNSEAALRAALTVQQDYDILWFDTGSIAEKTITLGSVLPNITKKLIVDGNGVTITQSSRLQLLGVVGLNAKVVIRQVHFKNGEGAVNNNGGILTLESCIFSGNRKGQGTGNEPNGYGGAVSVAGSSGSLFVFGCTFYNNRVINTNGGGVGYGGAISINGVGSVTLAGNLFYGNTASGSGNVVYPDRGVVTSLGYNVSDFADGKGKSGFEFTTGDVTENTLAFSPFGFYPRQGTSPLNRVNITALNADNSPLVYPTEDFYGVSINGDVAAGAVQTAGNGISLDIISVGSARGTFFTDPTPNSEGFFTSGTITLTAVVSSGSVDHVNWTVNDTPLTDTDDSIQLVLSADTQVRAEIWRRVTINSEETLRAALTALQKDDILWFDTGDIPGKTISLDSALPTITESLIIEGNGVTITSTNNFIPSDKSLLSIDVSRGKVVIRRVHFKNWQATGGTGGAVRNTYSALTLESCIFSGNQTTANGGAVSNVGSDASLTVLGCTFYKNSASSGGAIVNNTQTGKVTLAGNLFYGNTALSSYPVLYHAYTLPSSLGYNVSDLPDGTGTTQSGFAPAAGDKQLTNPGTDPLDPSDASHPYKPAAASLSDITIVDTSAIPGYPATDFYGTSRSGTVPAGAVANY